MKILATGMEWYEQVPGGLNQYFADYLKAMIRAGHQVEGLISGEGGRPEAPGYIRDVTAEPGPRGTYNRIKSFAAGVRDGTVRFAPDVFNPHFALYASMVTRSTLPKRVPIVTHFHGPWAQESQVEEGGHTVVKYVRYQVKRRIEQASYRRSDSFIVLSKYFEQVLSAKFGIRKDRIHVIPGAADTDRFRPADDRRLLRERMGIREETKLIFCARRLVRRMGIDHLIRAMGPVSRNVPEAVLCVAGEGPLRGELERLVMEMGLGSSVRLLGRVSNEDLVRWYQAADLSVVPSLDLEGFGLVTTEALACGTPVLGTPYGGTKEILERLDDRLLFPDKSPGAMAHKLVAVLNGASPLPARDECRRFVLRHYTWERAARSITRVFEQAVLRRKESGVYESSLL
jgi:glycosyltransferase involved in cell wall biosynthesis